MAIVKSKAWRKFLEAIDWDDLAAAQRCLSKSSVISSLVIMLGYAYMAVFMVIQGLVYPIPV